MLRETSVFPPPTAAARPGSIVTFCHLRWDSVFQRPHHLMSRFARECEVWFVEEPIYESGTALRIDCRETAAGVRVVQAHVPIAGAGFSDAAMALIGPALARLLEREATARLPRVRWLYTPMAL